jgi:thiol-disulfide isomerase/thioredoxin/Ca2+-binding EF-hand superfamily protein
MKLRIARHVVLPVVLLGATFGSWKLLAQDGKVLRQRFDQLDKNTDQKLSTEELTDKAIFAKLDSDSDGFVTLEEATAAFKAGTLTREEVEGRPTPKPEPDPISSQTKAGGGETKGLRQSAKTLRPADHGVGRYMADVSFADINEARHSLKEFKEKSFVVVAMTSTSCPLSRKYLPSLVELSQKYSPKNIQFIVINCVPTDRMEEMKTAAESLGESVCYVHDADESLSKHFGALTTTDVLVLDPARTVVYHGAIDDQYGIGYALDAPRNRFLANALEDLLEGRSPQIAATLAPGCTIEHDDEIVAESNWTYHNRISRIIQANCLECHRSGGVGPFPLESHADLVGHAGMIRQVVDGRTMPPWFAGNSEDKHASLWANDRSLTESDRADLLAWLASDKPEGDPADAPQKRHFVDGWTIGTPDLIVQIPEPIKVKATGTMPYQFVTAQTTLDEDKWIQGYEIVPTDRSVVHHVIVNVHEKGAGRIRDREEGIGGYWAAYVPGNAGQLYPDGFARKLPAGATVSFQIHYTPAGTATQDQLKMGLVFAKSEPKYVITTLSLADTDLNIPPHTSDHVETITRPVPTDVNVMAYMAHMHVRGKSFNYELIKPDGQTETLLDIPQYDFNWQLRYDYREPKVVPAGSRVKVTAVFDNSENNPANPDPAKTVHWGQQTFDEMMIGYVETFAPVGEEPASIRRAAGDGQALFKVLDTDADGKLSKDEATKAAERVPRLRDNPGILDRLFERNDADKDEKLSQDEFDKLRQQIAGRG